MVEETCRPLGRVTKLTTIQDRLRYLRVANEMTQRELSEEIFLSFYQISKMETGIKNVGHNEILLYSEFFGVSPNWLVTGKE